MKKIRTVTFLLVVFFTFSAFSYATENISVKQKDYENPGYYYETVIENEPHSIFAILKSTSKITEKSKSKTVYYKNSSGQTMWYVKVTGVFKYGNGTATCISSSVTAESNNSEWTVHNKSASRSGSVATAKATGKRHLKGVVVNTISKTVTLKCSPTGKFS